MASSYTPILRLTLPVTGELQGTWGDTVNNGITSLTEAAIAGTAAVVMSDADHTLTVANGATDEARRMFVTLTGTLSASRNVICPAVSKMYVVRNNTAGGQSIVFKTSAGSGITVANGQSAFLYCDGTNVVEAFSAFAGNAGSATVLQTTRTLWGQNFNGSANVTGALTDVTTLSMSGALTYSTGTANGVAYLNGSKVLTTGSALTFDGTTFVTTGNMSVPIAKSYYCYTSDYGIGTPDSFGLQLFYASGDVMRFGSRSAGTFSEQMRLTSTGLGIGTSSPTCKLDVQAPANGLLANFMENTSGAARRIRFSNNGTTNTIESTTGTGSTNLAFAVDGTERMRLDTSGNLGIGVVPSAWRSGARAFQLGSTGYVSLNEQANGSASLNFNCYESSSNTWTYFVTGVAPTRYTQLSGSHAWFTAPSGTAGSTVSFTQAMTLDASSRLAVNGADPTVGGGQMAVNHGANNGLVVNQTTSGTGAWLYLRNATDTTINTLAFTNPGVRFYDVSTATERARIDSSGNLLVGTSGRAYNDNSQGSVFNPVGQWLSGTPQNSGANMYLNAYNATGTAYAAYFLYNGTIVGSVSMTGTATSYNTSSDYRLKNIAGPVKNSGAYIDSLRPVEGTWKADGSAFVGLIAHEVQEVSRTSIATGEKDGPDMQAMNYSSAEIIANLIAEVQALRKRVAHLETA